MYIINNELTQKVGTGNEGNLKLRGLHRLIINSYLLMISFINVINIIDYF